MSLPNSYSERLVRLESEMETAMRDIAEEKDARKALETSILTKMDTMSKQQSDLSKIVYKGVGGIAAIMGALEVIHLLLALKH